MNTSGIITTIAGNGIPGYSGDGSSATAAELDYPYGIIIDVSGNIYFTDGLNNRIRVVNAAGIITTLAGSGAPEFSGDGGPATLAQMYCPAGLTKDAAGNVYVADVVNNRIREINTAGIINTVAGNGIAAYGDGGPATTALIYADYIDIDVAGNIFITEQIKQKIRKINTSGVISTYAGNGIVAFSGDGGPATNASISSPAGLVSDTAGNLYFGDVLNHRIRKISTAGIISTIAGTGVVGFTGDGGPATDAELGFIGYLAFDRLGNLYFGDILSSTSARVRKISSTGIISTFAGIGTFGSSGDGGPATTAQFRSINGIAIDNSGYVYIADGESNNIRVINTSGFIFEFAGNGSPGYGGDGGPASLCEFNAENGIASYFGNRLLVADRDNNCIRSINSSLIISTIAGNGTPGYYGDGGPATSANLRRANDVKYDHLGNIYINDVGNQVIRKVSGSPTLFTTNQNIESGSLKLYPNPADDVLNIASANKINNVVITNLLGQTITNLEFGSERVQVNVADLPPGIYLVKINNREVRKFVKQ